MVLHSVFLCCVFSPNVPRRARVCAWCWVGVVVELFLVLIWRYDCVYIFSEVLYIFGYEDNVFCICFSSSDKYVFFFCDRKTSIGHFGNWESHNYKLNLFKISLILLII